MSLTTATRQLASIAAVSILLLAAPAAAQAAAPPAPANSRGFLVLVDGSGTALASGSTTAQPGFAAAVAPAACPAGFTDAARLSVVPATGSASVISATTALSDPAAPATVPTAVVLADYALGDGATVVMECLSVRNGIPVPAATVFSAGLDISGTSFAVVPAPALPSATATATSSGSSSPTGSGSPTDGAQQGTPAATPGAGAPTDAGQGLASTGATVLPILLGAGGLVAAGVGAMLCRRRNAGARA
ncbi:hypothetical protein [Arthrobacter sp. 35W]|uniref:hypothetical protein n=1 Tax=Arthrobacter sp. 35W TaxID=1132441 RepID=UPI0003F4F36E|nr:hypothetical protein [Arthrobacter sp. 35W]